jgi:hypothetical protein
MSIGGVLQADEVKQFLDSWLRDVGSAGEYAEVIASTTAGM